MIGSLHWLRPRRLCSLGSFGSVGEVYFLSVHSVSLMFFSDCATLWSGGLV